MALCQILPGPTSSQVGMALELQQAGSLVLLIGLLITLPLIATWLMSPTLAMIDHLFRTGALVFGGGHVVLAALMNPIALHALHTTWDLLWLGLALALLSVFRWPLWAYVLLCALTAMLLNYAITV